MTNVQRLADAPRMPSTGEAKRDAIAALVDSVTGNLANATADVRKLCDRFDQTTVSHAARIKTELNAFVETVEGIEADAKAMGQRLEAARATHAKLVNQRIEE